MTEYIIHTSSVDIVANFNAGDMQSHSLTRGERATFRFNLDTDNLTDLTVSGTYTVPAGEIERYDLVTIEDGATLDIDGTLQANNVDNSNTGSIDNTGDGDLVTPVPGFRKLQEYADYAGGFVTETTLNNQVAYSEQIPDTADVNSILLGIEPSQTLEDRDVTGIWGLVSRGVDQRNTALNNNQYEIEMLVITEFGTGNDQQNTRSGVKTEFEI